tara:strand:+ start:2699 stop:3436 length:738 start_codon:yes stop_codon:yes gene_type:complete
MATLNLGRLKPVFRGAWNNATAYNVDDIVVRTNQSYISIQAGTNQDPATATAYWTLMAAAGTDVGAALANKEIAFKTNAGAIDGIPIGNAGEFLKVNSGATGYEFGSVAAGGLLKTDFSTFATSITHDTSYVDISNTINFTPTSASSDIIIMFNTLSYINTGVGFSMRLDIDGSDVGTWHTGNPITTYSGSGTAYHTIFAMWKYDNTSTSAKAIHVEGRRMDSSANAISQYNGRSSHLLIMEVGV